MKKWMVLAVLGLFLFGCDSDSEEVAADTGCDPTAEDACEEGLACLPVVAEAAEGEAEEAAEGEEAEEADAAEATVTYACQTPVVEEEEIVVTVQTPAATLSNDGDEFDHVAKGCNTFDNAKDGGDEAYGFCVDTGADGDDYCADTLGGVKVSGKCDGGATSCCSEVACVAYNSMNVMADGICLGQVAPTQGEDLAPALPECDGFIWMNSDCPQDAETAAEGNVGCCVPAEAGPEVVVAEEAAEEAAEGAEEAAEEAAAE